MINFDDNLFGAEAPASAPTGELIESPPVVPAHVPLVITEPGIYQIPDTDYHADPVQPMSLSRGNLADILDTTPAHARINHPRFMEVDDDDDEASEPKFDIGKAAHALFLEGVNVVEVVDPKDHAGPRGGIPKGWTSDAMKTKRKDIQSRGKIAMLPKQFKRVMAMVEAAHRQLAESELGITNLHEQGVSESTYIWKEGETLFRIRPDWLSHKNLAGDRKILLDYKTTGESANPSAFKASAYGKDIQHSLYRRGVQAIEGGKAPRFVFFVQETYPPYLCSVIGLDPQTTEMAKQKVDFGIFMWEQCLALNNWPGYPLRTCYVESKPWEIAAWESKSASIGMEE